MPAREIHRETILADRDSLVAAGTSFVTLIEEINGVPVLAFDELMFMLNVTQELTGTTPGMEIHIARPRPLGAVWDRTSQITASWEGLAHFDQTTPAVAKHRVNLPWARTQADVSVAAADYAPGFLGTGTARLGHWGDAISIWEEIAGTGLTKAIYDLYVTGIIHGR